MVSENLCFMCCEHLSLQYLLLHLCKLIGVIADENESNDENKERHCDSLIMCIVTTLNEGLRNGGGIGDVLRKPSSMVTRTHASVIVNNNGCS